MKAREMAYRMARLSGRSRLNAGRCRDHRHHRRFAGIAAKRRPVADALVVDDGELDAAWVDAAWRR